MHDHRVGHFWLCSVTSPLGEPIHLDLLLSQSDFQLIADCLGQGYVAGTDLIMNDPREQTQKGQRPCVRFLKVRRPSFRSVPFAHGGGEAGKGGIDLSPVFSNF